MATDFAVSLRRFLTAHLAGLRGCTPNTIASYRDTFKLLIIFFRDERSVVPEKLALERIDAAAVAAFLNWLQTRSKPLYRWPIWASDGRGRRLGWRSIVRGR